MNNINNYDFVALDDTGTIVGFGTTEKECTDNAFGLMVSRSIKKTGEEQNSFRTFYTKNRYEIKNQPILEKV